MYQQEHALKNNTLVARVMLMLTTMYQDQTLKINTQMIRAMIMLIAMMMESKC